MQIVNLHFAMVPFGFSSPPHLSFLLEQHFQTFAFSHPLSEVAMRRALLGFTFLIVATGIAFSQDKNDPYAGHIATTGPRTAEEERKAFHLPPGFDIELVAAEPAIHKPMNIAFDD